MRNSADIYALLAATVLLFYDTLLTLPSEITFLWRKDFSLVSALYVIGRYSLVVFLLSELCVVFVYSDIESCRIRSFLVAIVASFASLGIHGLLVIRAYAICHGRRWMPTLLGMVFLAFQGINIVHGALAACDPKRLALRRLINTLCAVSGALFDLSYVLITLYNIWGLRKLRQSALPHAVPSLVDLLLQQGAIRFFIVFTWALELALGDELEGRPTETVDAPLENAVSAILLCRFTLQLRKINDRYSEDSPNIKTLSSFRGGIARRVQDTIIAELGDPRLNPGGDKHV